MSNSSQKNKLLMIKFWSSKNFTNRAMYTLTGFEDIIDNEKYKDFLYRIDMAYDLISPELSTENNQLKPSKALAAIAFEKPPKPQDYQKLIELSHTASIIELKQFLVQDIDHQPTEKVIDYLTFPLLAMMTSHLKPGPKAEVLLLKPQIIHNTLETVRLKTLKEILTENDLLVLRMKAPQEIKDDLKIKEIPVGGWGVHVTTGCGPTDSRTLDLHIVEAQSHWANVYDARKITHQTGIGRQMALWRQKHNIRE